VQNPSTLGRLVPEIPQRGWKSKGSYEAHFSAASDEATTSGKRLDEAAKSSPSNDNYIDEENMIVQYNSNDMFGDQE
jgi:hypothetical protein